MKIYRLYDEHEGKYISSGNGRTYWSSLGPIKSMWRQSHMFRAQHKVRNVFVREFELKQINTIALGDII